MVPKILSKLVFPPPELPKIITNYPCFIERETPLKAATPYNAGPITEIAKGKY